MKVREPGMKKIGLELKKRRIQKGLTQQQLASKIGCDHTYISKIERGILDPRQGPREAVVRGLAENLVIKNESVDDLFLFFMTYLGKLPEAVQQRLVEVMQADFQRERGEPSSSLFKQIEKIVKQKTRTK
jgi:transcriptional regulator with XRE-family HTH domain